MPAKRTHLELETLEQRLTPYSVSSNAWPNPGLITIGFVPDGTIIGSNAQGPIYSNLQSTFNARFGSPANWENQILKAAQQWAAAANVNFSVVTDDGTPIGTGNYQQGDPNKADIRIGGYNFGNTTLAQTFMPPPVNNTSFAGDMQINTGQTWAIGGTYDLYTVATHELGHALGLYHSSVISASMYPSYTGIKAGLAADDINGVQAIYGPRKADQFGGTNTTLANAANITSALNSNNQAVLNNLSLNTSSSQEWFTFTVPQGGSGQLVATVQSAGLSMLDPEIMVYNSAGQLLASANGAAYGATANVTTSASPGQVLYVEVTSADALAAFRTGAFGVILNMAAPSGLNLNVLGLLSVSIGDSSSPTLTLPNTSVLDGTPVSAGGGQAITLNPQIQVSGNSSTQTNTTSSKTSAMDANGNFVVVYSEYVAGCGTCIFGQLYSSFGVGEGVPFQVNTFTGGNMSNPTVAMDATGDFVVSWTSSGQNGVSSIYSRSYNAQGTALSGAQLVNTTSSSWSQAANSSIAMDSMGDYVVTWSGNQSGHWEIYGQLFNALGIAEGAQFQVNTNMNGDHDYSSVAMDAVGDFVITWTSLGGQDGSGWGVYAQCYNAQGVAQGSEFRVNTYTSGNQGYSSVAMNPNTGNFVITWSSYGEDGSGWGVYAQLFSAQRVKLGGELQVNTYTSGDQKGASVAMDGNGNFLITWQSNNQGGTGWSIHSQQYAWGGATVGTEFCVDPVAVGNQQYASLTIDSEGDAVAVWTTTNGSASNVYAQRYLLDGGSGMVPGTATDCMVPSPVPQFWSQVTGPQTAAPATVPPTQVDSSDPGQGTAENNGRDGYFTHLSYTTPASQAGEATPLLVSVGATNTSADLTTLLASGQPRHCTCALCMRLARAMGASAPTGEIELGTYPLPAW